MEQDDIEEWSVEELISAVKHFIEEWNEFDIGLNAYITALENVFDSNLTPEERNQAALESWHIEKEEFPNGGTYKRELPKLNNEAERLAREWHRRLNEIEEDPERYVSRQWWEERKDDDYDVLRKPENEGVYEDLNAIQEDEILYAIRFINSDIPSNE